MNMGDLRLIDSDRQIIAFYRKGLLFAFNFSPSNSYTDVTVSLPAIADYEVALCSDDGKYGGNNLIAHMKYKAQIAKDGSSSVKLYLPARTAIVLKEEPIRLEQKKKQIYRYAAAGENRLRRVYWSIIFLYLPGKRVSLYNPRR